MSRHILILIIMLSGLIIGQVTSSSIQTDREWKEYTSVQKIELISLSNYLYENKLYDQAILSFFQYIYRYPGDSLEPLAYYYIGRCYEESFQPQLAIEYYEKIRTNSLTDTKLNQLAEYRSGISEILINNDTEVYDLTVGEIDPYLLTLRGLVEFRAMRWSDARQSFQAAEASFNDTYYSKLLREMYEYIDHAVLLSGKKRWITLLSSVFPGGGWVYLDDYNSAIGTFVGVTIPLIYTFTTVDLTTASLRYEYAYKTIIPANRGYSENAVLPNEVNSNTLSSIQYDMLSISLGTYLGSVYASYSNVNEANRNTVEEYIGTKITKAWLDDIFLNLEPDFSIY